MMFDQVMGYRILPSARDQTTLYFRVGDWRDTFPATESQTRIRFRATDFAGMLTQK
jgi:hypothetical protein